MKVGIDGFLRLFLIVLVSFLQSNPVVAAAPQSKGDGSKNPALAEEVKEIKERLGAIEERLEKIDAELEIIKSQSRMVIHRSSLGFLNQTYIKGGFALILPRARTIPFQTDTGLGVFAGIGQYFGRNHVLDLSLEWDLYPALSLRYRFEIHSNNPLLTFGPVIGYKIKAAGTNPFDNFLEKPQDVKNSFPFLGAIVGFPLNRSLLIIEIIYLFNSQQFIFANAGVHFFI